MIQAPAAGVVEQDGKVNVLLVASALWIGGAEAIIKHLAETIDRSRFNVTVCHLKTRGEIGDELARAGVDIVGLSASPHDAEKPAIDYLTFLKLRRLIKSKKIDVIHTHTVDGLTDGGLCRLFLRRVKLVHTFHFGNYPHARNRLLWMERIFSRLADRLFAVGDVQQGQIRSVHGLRAGRINTIRNGVPLPSSTLDRSFREAIGAGERIVVGTIATFIEQKGLTDLLRAAAKLRDAGHDNVLFVVVGDGPLRPRLEALRRELDLESSVIFAGWVTNAAAVALPAFDVFLQSSLWEAMSIVILEAMAAGKPIVATRVGENTHVIEDGKDGLLIDVKDVPAMASAIERVVLDAGLRARLGSAARRKVEQQFSVEHMTRAYEQVYRETLLGS